MTYRKPRLRCSFQGVREAWRGGCHNKATANGLCKVHGGIVVVTIEAPYCRKCPCYDDHTERCNLRCDDVDVGNGYALPKDCPLRRQTVLLKADEAKLTEKP